MTRLTSFFIKNYKAFLNKSLIRIKPITIIIGKNSSGKSALSRVPLLLSKSFTNDASEPIKIKFEDLEFGGSFKDLIHNKFEHGNIGFGLKFHADELGEIEIEFEVQNFFQSPIQVITLWSVKSSILNLELRLDLTTYSPNSQNELSYLTGKDLYKVSFKGVIPSVIKDNNGNEILIEELSKFAKIFNLWSEKVNYIGPFRAFPDRVYRHYGQIPNSIGHKGEFAPNILGMSTYVNSDLITNVGNWYKENLGGWGLDVTNDISSFEVVLISPDSDEVKINIADVGHGMSQVLPLIVRCYGNIDKNVIDIIEQPELHLHPAAHGALAELFVEASIKNQSSFIIETHSENFILRMRRLIVQEIIKPEDVIIYWIDDEERPGSSVREITVDENGVFSDWPEGVFSEDHEEILLLRKALLEKKNKA